MAGQELVLKIKTIQCTKITENEAQEEFLEDIKAESARVGRHAPLRPVSTEPRFREALLLGDGQSAPGDSILATGKRRGAAGLGVGAGLLCSCWALGTVRDDEVSCNL